MALTVLDAGVVIAILDAEDGHHAAARSALSARVLARDGLILPASAYAEVLVAPQGQGESAVHAVDAFLDALPATIEPVTPEIARVASGLRAKHGRRLRLPDALVVATAIQLRAGRVLTTDSRWPDLDVEVEVIGR
ncbi:MAG TPA: PIN domain-containing protein [Candidatus Limnocylindria bacterium]|nr:PIN domain-containing protein [Candidatus Limnocylindria bacterium]